jgi:hypothetical protein
MDIKQIRRHGLILAFIMAGAMLLFGNSKIVAREDDQSKPPKNVAQQTPVLDEQAPIKGYPVRKRRIGGPTDVEWDLDNSFPKRGSVLELMLPCQESEER